MIGKARLMFLTTFVAVALAAAPASAEAWQANVTFAIDSTQVPGFVEGATKARYLIRDPQGNPTGPVIETPVGRMLPWVEVPAVPGIYKLEAWLEDAAGEDLRRESILLPFDDVAPAPPAPEGAGRWLLATEPAVLRIGPPGEPLPLSGIRGYAVSLDQGEAPCLDPGLCTPAEIDLAGEGAENSLVLGTLPEGITYARVAAVSGAGVPSPVRTAVFGVDATLPDVSLSGVPSDWSAGPVKLTASAVDALSGMGAAGTEGPFTAIAVDGGAPAIAAGDTVSAWVSGSGAHSVAFYARDAAGNVADGSTGAPRPQTATVRIDEAPPQVRFAAAQDPAEPERIEALVSDPLSGASPSRGSIAVRLFGTRAAFERLPTAVTGNRLVARWDSDSYPPGKYEFLATGFDRAGNAGTGSDRIRGGKMFLVNPLKAQVALAARLSEGRLTGRLRNAAGGGLSHQEIVVSESFAPGARLRQRTAVLRTDGDGEFSLRLKPGPSRELIASFAGTPTLSRASSPAAVLQVPSKLQFRASRTTARVGGAPVVFSGKVAGAAAATLAGLPVELQFRFRGGGWSEFRTIEADARGRFRFAYRFSDDDSRGVRFRFRAYVKGREGWPYEPGASRPVLVTGR